MNNKISSLIKSHKKILIFILLVAAAAGYLGFQGLSDDSTEVQYITTEVKKGIIVSSVSGSGQINVSDQIDIKSEVSGKITALYVTKGQEVKTGVLLASIDSRDAERAVSDAKISLESAEIQLEELLAGSDAQSLLSAENALAQAKRDLEKAKREYDNIDIDTERALATAYDDGYNDVSSAFFKLSDFMKDLQDVLGTEGDSQRRISSYKQLLGDDSPLVKKLLDDYDKANNLYNKNFTFFREVSRDDDRDTVYQLISDAIETAREISKALESARHMYNAIVVSSYTWHYISSTIDKMQPIVESDLSSVFSTISSLQNTIDTIDSTVEDTPDKIKDAELAFKSAEEKVEDRKLALDKLKAGADSLDIRTQQNTVTQRAAALSSAREQLANHYIRVPFDGVIAEINDNVKKGDSVSSGTVLASIITEQKIAEITLNEIDVARVKVEQKATLQFDAAEDLSITGKVVEVDTLGTVNQGVVSYGVKIAFDVDDERIKPGMTVSTSIILDSKQNILLVPLSAVKVMGDNSYVEVLVNGQPQRKTVVTGLSDDIMIEIQSGLEEGEEVISQTISNSTTQNNGATQIPIGRMPGGQQSDPMRQMQRIMR